MKLNHLFLALCLLGFSVANASTEPEPSCPIKGKKNDIAGMVLQADTKKPLKDVNVTAYLLTKKEKAVQTDEIGNYAFDELKPGTYRFIFEKAGFKKVTREKVVVKTDEAFQLNIEMIESKDIDMVPSALHFADF